jgi:hypothetical protein
MFQVLQIITVLIVAVAMALSLDRVLPLAAPANPAAYC